MTQSKFLPTAASVAALLIVMALPASAQVSFSVGPQASTLGLGISGEVRLMRLVGVSAEYNFAPVNSIERSGLNSELIIDPTVGGALIMVMLHPMGGKFGLGAGLMQGGMNADASMTLDPNSHAEVEIGHGSYAAADIGSLVGTFEYGKTQPAFALGWMGGGFNFVFGAALATPVMDLEATGPIRNDPAFRADVDAEIADIEDAFAAVPVYPYLRLGWQFGF